MVHSPPALRTAPSARGRAGLLKLTSQLRAHRVLDLVTSNANVNVQLSAHVTLIHRDEWNAEKTTLVARSGPAGPGWVMRRESHVCWALQRGILDPASRRLYVRRGYPRRQPGNWATDSCPPSEPPRWLSLVVPWSVCQKCPFGIGQQKQARMLPS